MKRTLFFILFLVLVSVKGKAQYVSSACASVTATVIHPVGTGGIEPLNQEIPQPGPAGTVKCQNNQKILMMGRNRLLLEEARDPRLIEVISNGNAYTITVSFEKILYEKDQEIRIESISAIPWKRNKFYLNTSLSIEPGYQPAQNTLKVPCDVMVHFN